MGTERNDANDVERLLNNVLRDDLPPEVEFRMRKRLSAFRHAVVSFGDLGTARGNRLWRLRSAFVSWLPQPSKFRKRAFACLSLAMLATGAAIHLGGYRSVLADSISLFKMSMLFTQEARLAGSMECVIEMPSEGTQSTVYHIRWVRDAGTRIDIKSSRGVEETRWVAQGRVTTAASASRREPDLPEEVGALLSPADLARKLDGGWQLQPEKEPRTPDHLVFIDRQNRDVIEVLLDRKLFLPVSLSRKPPRAGGSGVGVLTARFAWNQPVAPQLMIPRHGPGK